MPPCPHENTSCHTLYRTSGCPAPVFLIQIEQIDVRSLVAALPVLRAERIRIILPVMIQDLRKMNQGLCMKNDLRHKINVLMHAQRRSMYLIINIKTYSEAFGHGVAMRTVVEDIDNEIRLGRSIIFLLSLVTLPPIAIFLYKIEIYDVGTGFFNHCHNLFHCISLEPVIRIGKQDVFSFSILNPRLPSLRESLIFLIDNDDPVT